MCRSQFTPTSRNIALTADLVSNKPGSLKFMDDQPQPPVSESKPRESLVARVKRVLGIGKSARTLRQIAKWYVETPLARAIVLAIPWAGASLHDLLLSTASRTDIELLAPGHGAEPFSELLESALRADEFILRMTRILSARAGRSELYKAYEHLAKQQAKEENIEIEALLPYLDDFEASKFTRENVLAPHQLVECGAISTELPGRISSVTFFEGSTPLLRIPDATLLWDCNCGVQAFSISGEERSVDESKCPIHRFSVGNDLSKMFGEGVVEIRYDGVGVLWKQKRELWPPSVDAFNLIEDLRRNGILKENYKNVIDIGCGTGFLGIWLTKHIPSIRKAIFSDWLISPLILSALNASRNLDDTHVTRRFYLGLETNWFGASDTEEMFNLLVCNPPYLPSLPGFDDLPLNTAVFGTELLENMIAVASTRARHAFISFSDLALPEKEDAEERTGAVLKPLGEPHRIPFRIAHLYDRHDYVRRLIDERGLEYTPHELYPLWHTVQTYQIT